MSSIGERLRQERLGRGLDLNEIAERTKIHASLLEAIESDEIDKLPGRFFTRSFVRQYARALGLDENDFDSELKRLTHFEAPPFAEPTETPREREIDMAPMASTFEPRNQHSFSALIAFLIILAACSAIYVFWQRSRSEPNPPETASEVRPAKYAQPPKPEAERRETVVHPAAAQPAAQPAAAQPAAAQPAATPVPAGAGQTPNAPIRIEVRAAEPAWVRVAADGKVLYTGTLQPNEPRTFEGAQAVSLRTGNAGGLQILFNGKPVGSLGPTGQIRTVEFTPADFKVLGPPPKPPVPAPPNDGL